jgi:hypothetical protein
VGGSGRLIAFDYPDAHIPIACSEELLVGPLGCVAPDDASVLVKGPAHRGNGDGRRQERDHNRHKPSRAPRGHFTPGQRLIVFVSVARRGTGQRNASTAVNTIQHGLTAHRLLLPGGSRGEQFCRATFDSLRP